MDKRKRLRSSVGLIFRSCRTKKAKDCQWFFQTVSTEYVACIITEGEKKERHCE